MANTHPMSKYFPLNNSSITGSDILDETIGAADIGPEAVDTSELATDALAASAAGRLKMATAYFNVAHVLKAFAAGSFTTVNLDALIADNQFTLALVNNLFTSAAIADDRMVSSIVKDSGAVAVGRLDFAGVATAAVTVTIGAATYLEADAPTVTNGEWTNGASANDSAVNLAAGINGDTRNSGGPSYAAIVLTDTVFVTALVSGTAGNVSASVSAGEPATIENLIGGLAPAVHEIATIMHTVTTLEVAVNTNAPEVIIPLPFDVTYFSWQAYDSNGGIYATELTARGTVTAASTPVPAYFRLANNGAADVQAGDIIRLVVQS